MRTRAAVALLCALLLVQPAAMAAAQPAAVQPDAADDLWNFDDEEEEVETWGTLLRDQAADLLLFTAFAALALFGFFRKSVPLKYVTLAAALIYLGFTKSQLISVVNV